MPAFPKVKTCGQKSLADDGFGDWDSEIEQFLDREYEDWQNPGTTYMVPLVFEYKNFGSDNDSGEKTEETFFSLLKEFGESRKEGMFVIHSCNFNEMITDWNDKQTKGETKWLLGEHDFVVIHHEKGIVFFQVKAATKTCRKFLLANNQLKKDKQSLQAFAARNLSGKMKRDVNKELHVYPGYVVMPNCARPSSLQTPSNGIFKEDCENVMSFAKWWDSNVNREGAIDQELFNCLVSRYVGMLHSSPPLCHSIDRSGKVLAFKTNDQLRVMLNSTPEQWITGPAGSGKTWLLMEKVKMLSQKPYLDKNGEKILVACFNRPLSKMLIKTFTNHLMSLLHGEDMSEEVVHVKTFESLLYEITGQFGETDPEKQNIVDLAVNNLEVGTSCVQQYDHIFVDECQDLYGKRWSLVFHKLWKGNDHDDDDGCESKHMWFFYDPNQYLALNERKTWYEQNRQNLKKSTKLTKVLRNTGHVFDQSKKYFQSILQNGEPLELGHKEYGLSINWDRSLSSRKVTEKAGAEAIIRHINELGKSKVQSRDISVLVESVEVRNKLTTELKRLNVECQDAEQLHEKDDDKVVVESIRRFKGLEAKVVILYNPCFFVDLEWTISNVKELLYAAVSRCFCYLIVVTTEEGYKALKSKDGFLEGTTRKRLRIPPLEQSSKGLDVERRSQMNAHFNDPYGKGHLDTKYESGPPEYANPSLSEDDEREQDGSSPHPVKVSRLEEKQYYRQYEKSKKSSLAAAERPLEVPGSDLLEPGDAKIEDSIRNNVFKLLCQPVQENLQYLPGSSAMDQSSLDARRIVARIEHEVYCKFRSDVNPRRYTNELRGLKKKIGACNKKKQGHEQVKKASESML